MSDRLYENVFNLLRLKIIDHYGNSSIKMGYADYIFKTKDYELLSLFLKEIEIDNDIDGKNMSLISDLIKSGENSNLIIAANLINQSEFKKI